jgi:hypothetical protein
VVAVSVLKPGDEDLHYSDNSHRWLSPQQDVGEDAWAALTGTPLQNQRGVTRVQASVLATPTGQVIPFGPIPQ